MKKPLILLIVLGAAGYLYRQQPDPEIVSDPVYAEFRIGIDVDNRTFDQVILVKTGDSAECRKLLGRADIIYGSEADEAGHHWKMRSSECKAEIGARYAALFDDLPTHVTYLSVGRGGWYEREARMVTWGVTVEESDMLCDVLAKFLTETRKIRSGYVTCIRSARS
jgi:hypothetical protein